MTLTGLPTYERLQRIGSNGFSHTFRAWAPRYDTTVVLKVYSVRLSPELASDFLDDLRALDAVAHPRLAPVLEGGSTTDGRPYLLRRRVAGRPLSTDREVATDDLDALCLVARGAAEALAALHAAGLAHGAITPDNLLVHRSATDPAVWLTDPLPATVARLRPDGFRHDPAFVAPEVRDCGVARPDGDVYSFAAALSAALGHVAAPVDLHDLLGSCLAARPEDRPTAAELAVRLRADPPRRARPDGALPQEGTRSTGVRSAVPVAVPTAAALRRSIRPGDLVPPDLSSLYAPTAPAPTGGTPATRSASMRWAVAGTVLGAALVGVGLIVGPDVLASRSAPPASHRTPHDVELAGPAAGTAPAPPGGLEVTHAALVSGPARQAQLKVAVLLDEAVAAAGAVDGPTAVVALLGRTGSYTPPPGATLAPRPLSTTPSQLGVAAVLGDTSVTAVPANPVDVTEEYLGADGRTRATFASRPDVPVFYVPDGSEVLGVAVLDGDGTVRAFASAAAWPALRAANEF